MKDFFKRKLIAYGLFFIILTIITLIYSLLIYYQKIDSSTKSFNIVSFIIGVIIFFVLGLISGRIADNNGLLEGLIAALIIILLSLIANLFIKVNFEASNFIKIGTYLISSGLGGVIGVNIKSKK